MKKKLLACALIFIQLLVLVSFRKPDDSTIFRVGTWNLKGSQAGITEQAEFLDELGLSLIALQEVQQDQEQSALDILAGDHFIFQRFYQTVEKDQGPYGIGMISRTGLAMPEQVMLPNNSYSTLEPRCLSVNMTCIDGKIVYVYNTHLSYENDEVRKQQIAAIAEKTQEHAGEYQLIFGDFNLRDLEELEALTGFTPVSTAESPMETYHGDDWDTKALDNILYSGNIELLDAEVTPTELSDHDVLQAEFRLLP